MFSNYATRVAFWVLTTLLISINNIARGADGVITLYTEVFTPYQFVKNKQIVGINTELVEKTCAHAKLNCQVIAQSWKRAYKNGKTKPNSGVFSTFRSKERENDFLWVGPLIHSPTPYIYALSEREDIQQDDIRKLSHLSIGVIDSDILGTELEKYGFERDRNLYYLNSRSDGLKLFFNGRLDLLVGSPISMPYRLAQRCLRIDSVRAVASFPVEGPGNYLALNKTISPEVHKKLQDSLNVLLKENVHSALLKEYENPDLPSHCN